LNCVYSHLEAVVFLKNDDNNWNFKVLIIWQKEYSKLTTKE
jgi:hypothetical protein